jgi:ISXO2-like transposase domain/Transposase zinc-ribbon domain
MAKRIHQLTAPQFDAMFPDEYACKTYLVGHRWPDGVFCPRCGNADVSAHALPFHWQCTACAERGGYRFSVLVGTVFENTNIDMRRWFKVIHLMLTSKKGISALQIMRYMGFGSYKTAWYMCHRIRAGLVDRGFQQLLGIVEADETFIGGKARNRHIGKRGGPGGGTGSGKIAVAGAVSRKGKVVARVLKDVKVRTVVEFVRQTVSHKVSLLCTDAYVGYRSLGKEYPHGVVNHQAGEYVVGAIHTNTIEGFWSLIKRGMVGTFHKVSRKYLPLYVAEFRFRYNNRENADIFGTAIKGC